ncbi:alpha/beta hydrolase family protein (plasmid) [Sphingomonas panni]
MVADFYLPAASRPVPAILLLGGSEGGLSKGGAREARLLAERGYAVLHLSYFGSPGQPATLKMIPVETFDRALDWLKAQAEVAGDRIGVIGTSKVRKPRCWSHRAAPISGLPCWVCRPASPGRGSTMPTW